MIKFSSNYIGNQHWDVHLVRRVHGLRVTMLNVKEIENAGVPLLSFKVRHMKCLASLHIVQRRTMAKFTFLVMLSFMTLS